MKILKTIGTHVVAILDDNNYTIHDTSKPRKKKDKKGNEYITYDYLYFNKLHSAVKEASRLKANRDCTNLEDWLVIYKETNEATFKAVEG